MTSSPDDASSNTVDYPDVPESSPQRPRGIVVLAIFQILGAIGAIINLGYLLPLREQQLRERLSSMQSSPSDSENVAEFSRSLTSFVENAATSEIRVAQITSIIAIPLSLLLAWGLWKLHPWARILTIICYALSIFTLLSGHVVTAIIAIAWVIYLTRPHVGAAFQRT